MLMMDNTTFSQPKLELVGKDFLKPQIVFETRTRIEPQYIAQLERSQPSTTSYHVALTPIQNNDQRSVVLNKLRCKSIERGRELQGLLCNWRVLPQQVKNGFILKSAAAITPRRRLSFPSSDSVLSHSVVVVFLFCGNPRSRKNYLLYESCCRRKNMPSNLTVLCLVLVVLVVCMPGHGVYAFGAGNIPRYVAMTLVCHSRLMGINQLRVHGREGFPTWRYCACLVCHAMLKRCTITAGDTPIFKMATWHTARVIARMSCTVAICQSATIRSVHRGGAPIDTNTERFLPFTDAVVAICHISPLLSHPEYTE